MMMMTTMVMMMMMMMMTVIWFVDEEKTMYSIENLGIVQYSQRGNTVARG